MKRFFKISIIVLFSWINKSNAQDTTGVHYLHWTRGNTMILTADTFFNSIVGEYLKGDTIAIDKLIRQEKKFYDRVYSIIAKRANITTVKNERRKLLKAHKDSMLVLKGLKIIDYAIFGLYVDSLEGKNLYAYNVYLKLKGESSSTIYYCNSIQIYIYDGLKQNTFWGNLEKTTPDLKSEFDDIKKHFKENMLREQLKKDLR